MRSLKWYIQLWFPQAFTSQMLQTLQGLSDNNCFSSPTNVCEVQPQQHQVPLVLLGFLEQLCDHACVLQTPQHHQDHSFLDPRWQCKCFSCGSQVPGYIAEEYLSLHTEQCDSSELINGVWILLLWNPHLICSCKPARYLLWKQPESWPSPHSPVSFRSPQSWASCGGCCVCHSLYLSLSDVHTTHSTILIPSEIMKKIHQPIT